MKTTKIFGTLLLVLSVLFIIGSSMLTAYADEIYFINNNFDNASFVNLRESGKYYGPWRAYGSEEDGVMEYALVSGENKVLRMTTYPGKTPQLAAQKTAFSNHSLLANGPFIMDFDFKFYGEDNVGFIRFLEKNNMYLFEVKMHVESGKYGLFLANAIGAEKLIRLVEKDTWYNIKVMFDTTVGTYKINALFIDGVRYTNTLDTTPLSSLALVSTWADFSNLSTFKWYMNNPVANTNNVFFELDNYKFYTPASFAIGNYSPQKNSDDVNITSSINIQFNYLVDSATLGPEKIIVANLSNYANIEYSNWSVNEGNNTVTISFMHDSLDPETNYRVIVLSGGEGVKDVFGRPLAEDLEIDFRTGLAKAVDVENIIFSPVTEFSNVTVNSTIAVRNLYTYAQDITVISALIKKIGEVESYAGYTASTIYVPAETSANFGSALSIPKAEQGEEYFIRLYFWDGIDTMNGLDSTRTFSKDGLITDAN